jgi:hypothetical protein
MLFLITGPEWRNWQTRRTQNPVAARPCGFDPLLRDHFFAKNAIWGIVGTSRLRLLPKKEY